MNDCSDELKLLNDVLLGVRASADALVQRYDRLVRSCVRKTLQRYSARFAEEDLDDLAGDVWLQLLRDDKKKLRQFQAGRGYRLASWIGLIATNVTIDHLRARAQAAAPLDEVMEPVAQPEREPEALYAARQRAELATRALGYLSHGDRQFLKELLGDERSPDEMAQSRRVSVNTIYSRKFKLQAKLAHIVETFSAPSAA